MRIGICMLFMILKIPLILFICFCLAVIIISFIYIYYIYFVVFFWHKGFTLEFYMFFFVLQRNELCFWESFDLKIQICKRQNSSIKVIGLLQRISLNYRNNHKRLILMEKFFERYNNLLILLMILILLLIHTSKIHISKNT